MAITITADSAVAAEESRGTKFWTRTTLAEQLQGELSGARAAGGASVPDRLDNIVYESFGYVWECHDWICRRRLMSVELASGEETWTPNDDSYTDFEKIDHNWLIETAGKLPIEFTTDVGKFEAIRAQWVNASRTLQAGEPEIAYIEPDTAESNYRVMFRFAPKADGAYIYRAYYMATAPALTATQTPKWPTSMFRLWHIHAKFSAQSAFFPNDNKWESTYRHFAGLLAQAKEQNDEHLRTSTPRTHDGYGDNIGLATMGDFDVGGGTVTTDW